VHVGADWMSEMPRFIECDHQGVRERVDLRRENGQPLSDGLNLKRPVQLG
jgi:hypothetical protein